MGMNYKPEEMIEGGGRATAGRYHFKIDEAQERTFKSGNDGLEVKLLVAAFDSRDVTVYDRFVFLNNSTWKLKQFFDAIGVDFNNPPDAHDLIGLTGEAEFEVGEKGYIEAGLYIAAGANSAAPKPKAKPVARVKPSQDYGNASDDNVPF